MFSNSAKSRQDNLQYDEPVLSPLVKVKDFEPKLSKKLTQEEEYHNEWFIERTLEEDEVVERKMAHHCFLRSLLTILHAVIGLGAGFICVYSLIGWNFETTCLPKLVDHFGDPVKFQNGIPSVCDGIVYGMGALCFINFLMCLMLNCLWYNICVAFLHLLLTTIFVAFTVLGGTTFTMYYMLWCDSLEQTRLGASKSCEEAARIIDKHNATGSMSLHRQRMEVQQVSIWALFPLTFIAVLAYSLVILLFSNPDNRHEAISRGQYRYVIMHEESTPLFNQTEVASDRQIPRSRSVQSLPTAPGGNPFES